MAQNLNLTKEEAIDLYLKIMKSDNRDFMGSNFAMMLYRGKTPICYASFGKPDRNITDRPADISVGGCYFLLTTEEEEKIESEFEMYFNSITKQDILNAL